MKDKDKIKAVINLINYIDGNYNIPIDEMRKLQKAFKSHDIQRDLRKLITEYPEVFQYYEINPSIMYLFSYKGFHISCM